MYSYSCILRYAQNDRYYVRVKPTVFDRRLNIFVEAVQPASLPVIYDVIRVRQRCLSFRVKRKCTFLYKKTGSVGLPVRI